MSDVTVRWTTTCQRGLSLSSWAEAEAGVAVGWVGDAPDRPGQRQRGCSRTEVGVAISQCQAEYNRRPSENTDGIEKS